MNWDLKFKVFTTAFGSTMGYIFGGWGGLLPILLAFMIIDQLSGLLASIIEGKLSSKVGFKGIAKKVVILFVVVVAHLIDIIWASTGMYDGHMVREGVIFFYLGNELISFIENAGRMGVPLPAQLLNAVDILKGKSKESEK